MANLQGAQYLLTQPAKGEYAAKIKITAIFLLAFYKTPLFYLTKMYVANNFGPTV